ncbi:MAG: hypothetical protein LLG08_07075 [Actinomycetia bacterium]|nr:hypothetical protein [Actinomycetes bacterium]
MLSILPSDGSFALAWLFGTTDILAVGILVGAVVVARRLVESSDHVVMQSIER